MKKLAKLEKAMLREFGLDERWLQDQIVNDPEILGIPNVFLRDRERQQPGAGRFDVLLETADNEKRYEVEVQLGATNETHIIRTLEYWDLERKRYPQYEHCAVIVAEDITSRFFNVIGLFNGVIPIMAINVTAVKQPNDEVGLLFTRVLSANRFAKEESKSPDTGREAWIERYGEKATTLAEYICTKLGVSPRYTKFYIGVDDDNAVNRNKMKLSRRGRKGKPIIRIDFDMEQKWKWHQALGIDGGLDESSPGYYYDVYNHEEVDGSFQLLRGMYRDAAGYPELPEDKAEESDATD